MKKLEHISKAKIDGNGRILIPSQVRKILNIKKSDTFEVFLKDGIITISLEDVASECYCCGKIEKNMVDFLGRKVCGHCVKSIELAADKIRSLYIDR